MGRRTPPVGQEANWIPTDPARKFGMMFRLYGPKQEFFSKARTSPDVERVATTIGGATK
ncbi:DUF1214 domain-containing protein [Bradyrhizobium sp. OK095]|uniref:DUF1214 domain-containing protein n=1 Tax=Bradyrhizobium sp. OK095 TaxID=1882760 RepID=UPI00115FC6BE